MDISPNQETVRHGLGCVEPPESHPALHQRPNEIWYTQTHRQKSLPSSKIFIKCLPLQWHLIFHTLNHYLLTYPVLQRLSRIASASSARRCYITPSARIKLPDMDEIFLERISLRRLIPSLSQLDNLRLSEPLYDLLSITPYLWKEKRTLSHQKTWLWNVPVSGMGI